MNISIVMPCLNEAETLAVCIQKAKRFLNNSALNGEVIVADNGSTDGSIEIAKKEGAVVIFVPQKGYGSALRGGIQAANNEFIIIGDSDDSHDLENLGAFVNALENGNDLVIGNRFKGGLSKSDMSFLHRFVGNPILTGLGNLFFKTKIGDFHCGLRGFTKKAFQQMELTTDGMEFASEMIVKAQLNKLTIVEVPTKVFPSGRSRAPHLNTWKDGWRHLRFLLLYSPQWLFFIPGIFLMLIGVSSAINQLIQLVVSPEKLLLSCGALLAGFQFVLFYGLTKIYATEHRLFPKSRRYDSMFKFLNLEKGLLIGSLLCVLGGFFLIAQFFEFIKWIAYTNLVMNILGVSIAIFGIQIMLFSLFFSVLGLKKE